MPKDRALSGGEREGPPLDEGALSQGVREGLPLDERALSLGEREGPPLARGALSGAKPEGPPPAKGPDQPRTIHRLKRLGWLLANLGACVQFAGGGGGFLKRALRTLAAGQWRHLVAWMVMAVSYVHRADGRRYRRWLARTAPPQPPDGRVKAVLSSVGVPARQLAAFLALISAQRKPWLDLVVVVEKGQRRQVEAHFQATGEKACIVDSNGNAATDMLYNLRLFIAASKRDVPPARGGPSRTAPLARGSPSRSPRLKAPLARGGPSSTPGLKAPLARGGPSSTPGLKAPLARGGPSSTPELKAPRYIALLAPGCIPGDMPLTATGSVLLYGDEDAIDGRGERSRPLFKPAFSPDLLLHRDYMSSCLMLTADFARSIAERAMPTVPDLHSLALLLTDVAERVEHLDAFAVHRLLPAPKAGIPEHLGRHLRDRYGEGAAARKTGDSWTCSFGSRDSGSGKVSIIIPTRDRIDLLAPCIEGIHATNQGSFECIIIDNGSTAPETKRWLADAPTRFPPLKVVEAPEPFNWSRLNNQGMRHAEGDVFLFLNNDTEAACEGWADRLADVALRPDVGAVGGLLLYPDGLIQHAGVVTGFGGCADHIYVGTDPDAGEHMFVSPTVPRNVSAVTGACLAVARSTVDAIGGFDEGYRIVGSDVEFCIRAMRAGRRNVYLPDVRLVHHESQSRTRSDPEADVERLRALIAQCPSDPYFNPKLSMVSLYPSYPV